MAQNNFPLTLKAGPRARAHITQHGLRPSDIAMIPGAAGGPKALGLLGLDLAIFGDWLKPAVQPIHLIGSSVGAWRFANACRDDPAAALKKFAQLYTAQRYPKGANARYVADSVREVLAQMFDGAEAEVVTAAKYRLHIIAARGIGPLKRDGGLATKGAFSLAVLANLIGRKHLRHFFARTVFSDARAQLPLLGDEAVQRSSKYRHFDQFHTQVLPLNADNLREALRASGAIPLVIESVANIPGAQPGPYWDGGLIDYHLNFPYNQSDGIVLFPHFTDHIIPGWLDKPMPWRRAQKIQAGGWLDNVLLVAPSRSYLDSLPYKKLPDRNDFKHFMHDVDGRVKYWEWAIGESERLGDTFMALVEGREDFSGRVQAL